MRDEKRIESAIRMVERAERSVQQAGFDPDAIVSNIDVENLTIKNRFYLFNLFMRKLELADVLVAENQFIPNPDRPYDDNCFKTDGTVLVVYENEVPVWHMERHDNKWIMYRLDVSISNIPDYDWEDELPKPHMPKPHMPKRRLENVRRFIRNIEQADDELTGESYDFPNPFNLGNNCLFKTNGSVMVAYQQDTPVWYMKKEDDEWQKYEMSIFLNSVHDFIDNSDDENEYRFNEFEDSIHDILEDIENELDDPDEI